MGDDVLYSGTVAAASEAAMRGIPALAVSQLLPRAVGERPGEAISPWHPPHRVNGALDEALRQTAAFAVRVAAQMLESTPPKVVINLNAPANIGSRGESYSYPCTNTHPGTNGERTF